MKLDKKKIIMVAGTVGGAVVLSLMMGPLFGKVSRAVGESKALERKMKSVREAIDEQEGFQQTGKLLTRQKVSLAIDEMTKVGAALDINFLSIDPQQIIKPQESKYPVLPIQMDIQSEYENLGRFLGALERLQESIITVESFQIEADRMILPKVEMQLIVEVYLQEQEDENG